jgi:hypothetical protein
MLTHVYRDFTAMPQGHQEAWRHQDTHYRDVLAAPFGGTGDQQRRIGTVIGHATSFWTWRSLGGDQGLSDHEAVQVMTAAVLAITGLAITGRTQSND